MPTVRAIVRRAAQNGYKFSSLVLGVIESGPFQMKMKKSTRGSYELRASAASWKLEASEARSSRSRNSVHHQKASLAADVPERRRRHHGAAAARVDASGRDRAGADGRQGPHAVRGDLCPARRDDGQVDAGHGRRRLRAVGNPAAAQAVLRAHQRDQRSQPPAGVRRRVGHVQPQPLRRDVPERRPCGGRTAGASGHHDGPVRRAAHRPGHAAPVDRDDDRGRDA